MRISRIISVITQKAVENYWGVYYLVYVGCVAFFLYQYGQDVQWGNLIYVLAAIFSTSAGIAILVVIVVEGVGRMVLLIPAAVKKLKAEGRREGREEERIRWRTWAKQQGYEVPPYLTNMTEKEDTE